MSTPKWAIPRRSFLKGTTATLSLPFLEAMLPYMKAHAQAINIPPRMIYLWFDLGVYKTDWVPSGSGTNWTLPSVLSPLAAHKNDITMLRRVRNYYGDSHNEGGGDHARSIGTFLTCAHARYGDGHPSADFGLPTPTTARLSHQGDQTTAGFAAFQASAYGNKITGSADQLAARMAWNNAYKLKSLQMRVGGGGDSHHNDVNQHLSWTGYNTPAPRFQDVRSMFDVIFQNQRGTATPPADNSQDVIENSIIDSVIPAVNRLNQKVGSADKQRLDKYLTEVRELERKVSTAPPSVGPVCGLTTGQKPATNSLRFDDHIRTTLQLFVKAFECDITRVVSHGWHYGSMSFLQDDQGRSLTKETHNFYSHHGDDPEAVAGLRRINKLWATLLAEFLQNMKQVDDNYSGTLLDNSQIMFGCGMMDGNAHNSERNNAELPLILAGRASGKWTPGKVIDTGSEIRLSNIHVNILKNMGFTGSSFGDSNGTILNL